MKDEASNGPNFDDPTVKLILDSPPQRTTEELKEALVDAESRMQGLKAQEKTLKVQLKGLREDMKDIDVEIDGIMEQLG